MVGLIIHLQICSMAIVAKPMMIMAMIMAIHLIQETIQMNARHHENMMYRDMIVSRTVRLYM